MNASGNDDQEQLQMWIINETVNMLALPNFRICIKRRVGSLNTNEIKEIKRTDRRVYTIHTNSFDNYSQSTWITFAPIHIFLIGFCLFGFSRFFTFESSLNGSVGVIFNCFTHPPSLPPDFQAFFSHRKRLKSHWSDGHRCTITFIRFGKLLSYYLLSRSLILWSWVVCSKLKYANICSSNVFQTLAREQTKQ